MKTLKRVTKNIKKDIMAYAWKLARIEAEETNCSPRECIGWALHVAWETLRFLCTACHGYRKTENTGSFLRSSSKFAIFASAFPNVCRPIKAIQNDENKEVIFIGTQTECESFRFGHSWAEYYGDIEHSSYISGYQCPMIWAF